ncbi:hypothetical protein AI2897V1_1746 [Klebsiella pneumoniae]|nr:hypothetical protein AI2586V1_1700 [Klebsiella pneumoniae]CAF2623329.1 hypothetical protein AI2876V1_1699 [Klebsiella pneumoniae]CAF2624155.1 hypothetical protein AI2877V1_1747 [Klebsiella pneumoniae]CAF2730010.1 hypothetical protein AI2897V1_1746 [Klebsiella pneumoniae]CAH3281700.1 hypothetical protein AI2586V1_1700 [Klebsiella pneumoniae]
MNINIPALINFDPAGIKKSTCMYISDLPGIVLYDTIPFTEYSAELLGNDSNLLIVFYVQIMPDDFVMQLHRF